MRLQMAGGILGVTCIQPGAMAYGAVTSSAMWLLLLPRPNPGTAYALATQQACTTLTCSMLCMCFTSLCTSLSRVNSW